MKDNALMAVALLVSALVIGMVGYLLWQMPYQPAEAILQEAQPIVVHITVDCCCGQATQEVQELLNIVTPTPPVTNPPEEPTKPPKEPTPTAPPKTPKPTVTPPPPTPPPPTPPPPTPTDEPEKKHCNKGGGNGGEGCDPGNNPDKGNDDESEVMLWNWLFVE